MMQKLKKDCINIKFFMYPTSEKSDLYEFKRVLLDNGNTEEFLFFMQNFQIILEASGSLAGSSEIYYLLKMLCGGLLCKLDTFCVKVGSTTTAYLNRIISGIDTYCFPINAFPKKNHAMRRRMRNTRKVKVR